MPQINRFGFSEGIFMCIRDKIYISAHINKFYDQIYYLRLVRCGSVVT